MIVKRVFIVEVIEFMIKMSLIQNVYQLRKYII